MSKKVEEYLSKKKESAGNDELAEKWNNLEKLYRKKLWHPLTEAITVRV